jgi:hypothetical protein
MQTGHENVGGSAVLSTDGPAQRLINVTKIPKACKVVMKKNLKETRDRLSNLTDNAELHYRLI